MQGVVTGGIFSIKDNVDYVINVWHSEWSDLVYVRVDY